MQFPPAGDLTHGRTHEGLEGDLRTHRIARQAEDRRALHGADAEPAARGHGDGVEAHRPQGGQDVLDGVPPADRQPAGGDQDVGPHELILDGLGQDARLVGHGGHAEGPAAGVGDGRRHGVAVGVEHVARVARLAGLDQLVADRDDDDPRGGADVDAGAPDAGQQGHMASRDARPLGQHRRAGGDVGGTTPHVLPRPHRRLHPHADPAAVGVHPRHDGVGTQR